MLAIPKLLRLKEVNTNISRFLDWDDRVFQSFYSSIDGNIIIIDFVFAAAVANDEHYLCHHNRISIIVSSTLLLLLFLMLLLLSLNYAIVFIQRIIRMYVLKFNSLNHVF